MQKRNIIAIVLIISCFFIANCTFAEEVTEKQVDFLTAIKFSLEHNNNIRAMRKNLSATERDIGIERSAMLPKVIFHEDFMCTNNPTDALSLKLNQARATERDLAVDNLNHPASVPNFLTSGTVKQTILDKKALVKIKMAKKEYSANGYTFLRMQEDLITRVALAYLTVNTDKALLKIAEEALADAQEHLKIAEARYAKSIGIYSDILRAKSALESREQKLISAQKNLKISKRNLGLLLGLDESVDILNSVPEIKLENISYYKEVSIYRNDVKATEIRVENAKNNIDLAKAEWYPTLKAAASYNFYNSSYPFGGQGSNYIAGAFFEWELFDGNKRKYELLKAKDKEGEIKEYLEGLKKNVNFKVFEAFANVEEHRQNLEIAIVALQNAEKDSALVEKRWKSSQLPFVSLIDAQTNLDLARANVVMNQFDMNEDLINLMFESGIIYQELLN